ncbi:HigA family addiction module antitoxin [Candidatus Palauibacter soopunensis]|uniref:HigA family addiction module antitoxin n=1 Tax=Candidatus Palauibacter soopunensis TaxID=3056739 RepID=UPI002873579F|nr:HigA family addiction module antitoxin [Candidatus Palauibacter soopunensis]
MNKRSPLHPGEFIRLEVVESRDLTVVEAAAALGVSRPALSAFLNGRSDLSGTMALRIEKAFGVNVEQLMRMQADYDSARIRRREDEINVEPYGVQAVREKSTPYETLHVDNTVMRRLREEAERRQTTASELLEAGLRRVLAERVPADAGSDALKPLPTWRGGEPRVDIADRDALYRLMEEE